FAGGAGSQQDIEFGFSDRLRQIDADRAAFSVTIAQNRAAAVPAAKREADEAERALRAEAERLLLIKQSNLERDIAAGTLRTTIPLRGGGTGLPKLEGGLGPAFKPEKFPERELFVQDLEKATIKTRPEKVDSARLAAEAMALLGAMKQGGAAGILGAGAGIAADLGGIKGAPKFLGPLGIGLNVASGLVNLFDRSQERHTKQIVDALERLGKEVGLERVTLVFTGPDGHQTRKTLAELEAGDAVERVPGPVGATG
ncbi:MAG TPA: hypothetical protein VJS20_02000, partial [Gemmatimonadales bacterium]|nr:hypothetical protein [Gemmatimonadales bacterium]